MGRSYRFSIDRGGTFCDIYCEVVTKNEKGDVSVKPIVKKLLSEDPANYKDAPTEGIRRIIENEEGKKIPTSQDIDISLIESIRMGTTVATNALLERKGEPNVLVITKGFRDLLRIGNQSRPKIFDLEICRPEVIYDSVIEVNERVLPKYNEEVHTDEEKQELEAYKEKLHELYGKDMKEGESSTGQPIWVEPLKTGHLQENLEKLHKQGVKSIAVVLLHSYMFPDHELTIEKMAKDIGFSNISLSHKIMPMIRAVPRGLTTCVDAYLTPILRNYVDSFCSGFKNALEGVNVSFMQSDGGLTPADNFMGSRAILSGPAGGVVGYSSTAYDPKTKVPIISFDMGGTSCDVSRFGGEFEHIHETEIAGTTIQAPQLDIQTVAAGGGSCLTFQHGQLQVGPESAGSHPGPVCYRKGGPLAVTDANLFLGRIQPEYFPHIFGESEKEPLDYAATKKAFEDLAEEINTYYKEQDNSRRMSPEEIAYGFIEVANEAMCRPIRSMTISKGLDARNHELSCFGGAGAQHACAIAKNLKMNKVKIHRYSGILSAYGLGLANVVQESQESCQKSFKEGHMKLFNERIRILSNKVTNQLKDIGFTEERIEIKSFLNLRYDGTDYTIMSSESEQGKGDYVKQFEERYHREYGFIIPDRTIIVDDIRVRGIGKTNTNITHQAEKELQAQQTEKKVNSIDTKKVYFDHKWYDTPIYRLTSLPLNSTFNGPAMIIHDTATIIVQPKCLVHITQTGDVEVDLPETASISKEASKNLAEEVDTVKLSIFAHRFMSIAEQMGKTLQRTSISTNIKERLDFSCAIFGPEGHLIANAPHLPVHLGSMSEAVSFQIKYLGDSWKEGEVLMANHPVAGGTHLPDITVITPVYDEVSPGVRKPVFYVASRGHHADIGGIKPGSMPPFSKKLSEEGAAIISCKIVKDQRFDEEAVRKALEGTRCIRDNLADLKAQVASNKQGIQLINELIKEYSLTVVQAYMKYVQDNANFAVREMLYEVAKKHGPVLKAEDFMDDGSKIKLKINIDMEKRTGLFDFTGTSAQVDSNTNAPRAVAVSAILYCLRCLISYNLPLNDGCLQPIKVIIPEKCILNPEKDRAVVGGNVLTSQRVTDVILKAFKAVAASQGCMNNFIFGNKNFGYYETICGGAGAGPNHPGQSGVHTHMTNTRITDVEILEQRYPVSLLEFSIRNQSGGKGKNRGGDGVVRRFLFHEKLSVGVLTERRVYAPYGLYGGQSGEKGKNIYYPNQFIPTHTSLSKIENNGSIDVGGRCSMDIYRGDVVAICSPGGGGFGTPEENE